MVDDDDGVCVCVCVCVLCFRGGCMFCVALLESFLTYLLYSIVRKRISMIKLKIKFHISHSV